MSSSNTETELVFYAKLNSYDGLDEAEVIEDHIQLESTFTTGPRMRVRRITPVKGGPEGAGDQYILTLKVKVPGTDAVNASTETNVEVDRNFYENFGNTATRGMKKRRYHFTGEPPTINGQPIPGVPPLCYEVDVFTGPNGRVPYIKIDVELDKFLEALKPHGYTIDDVRQKFTFDSLPLQMEGVFYGPDQDEQQKALLDDLWENQFTLQLNPEVYVKQEEQQQPDPLQTAETEEEDAQKLEQEQQVEQTEETQDDEDLKPEDTSGEGNG